jgi:hypothetical protein
MNGAPGSVASHPCAREEAHEWVHPDVLLECVAGGVLGLVGAAIY